MAIKIGSNFTFQGKQPNFERDRFATKTAMKAFPETSIDDGHLSYCVEDGNTYQFKSSNSIDDVTGKWRVFKADVDLSAYATKDSVATDLAKKTDLAGVIVSNSLNDKSAYLKVLTITIPNTQFQIGLLEIVMTDRSSNKINVSITIDNTSKVNPLVNVIETIDRINIIRQPLYYYKDFTSDDKVISLYFKMTPYDYASVKVINKGGNMPFIYTLDLQTQEVLPEGVIQVHNINYNVKNLFYATPKDDSGDPKFRAIDITDLPDLSSKYATKEKAFTKDTASTEPGQFVAGPATTQGNLHLRKLIADDIPDLKSKYQPKYNADYIATSDISTLPITNGVIDLNGHRITLPNIRSTDGDLTIRNGIVAFGTNITSLEIFSITFDNVTIISSDTSTVILKIQELKCFYVVASTGCDIDFLQEGSAIYQATLINSYLVTSLPITDVLTAYNSVCLVCGNIALTAYNSFVGDDGISLANGSAWYNTQLDTSPYYTSGWVDETGKMHCGMFFDDTITGDSDYAPQTKAVYNSLQLKADKTQLADLATQTDFVDLRNKVNAMPKTVFITQAAYDALTTKDANTIYYING